MSTVVKSVYDALKSNVTTTLGADWTELRFLFDVEQNDQRTLEQGFGVTPLAAVDNPSILKTYTLDQDFQIILTRTQGREIDDTDKINALLDAGFLYDQASEIFKSVLNTQLGIPAIVMSVSNPNMDAPLFLANAVVLNITVTVKWRETLV